MDGNFLRKNKKDILTAGGATLAILLIIGVACLIKYFGKTEADVVIFSNVFTGVNDDSLREAAVVKDGKFIYVGNKNNAESYIGENTEVLNYSDGMMLAGVSDTHTHVTMDFMTAKDQISLSGQSIDEYMSEIAGFITAHPEMEMYLGMGWNYECFENEVPTKDILDQLPTNKPIYLKSSDAHSAWVNSAMLEKMGITKDTPDPVGGEIKRDASGEAVGMLKESALGVFAKPLMPVYSVEEYKDFILQAQKFYAELGYTAYIEMFTDTDTANSNLYQAYEELDKEGKLILRTQGAWVVNNSERSNEDAAKAIRLKDESSGGMFEITEMKFFMDGVVESGGAFLSVPYGDDVENFGMDRWPGEESFKKLVDLIILANQNGMDAHFHAMGDAAVTKALDAVEAARQRVVNPEVKNVITHLEVVKDSDAPRFKELDVAVAANVAWGSKVSTERYDKMEVKRLGEERAANAYPYKKLVDAGAMASFATDYPPGSVAYPFASYSVGISRSILGLPETVRNEELSLTREEGLMMLTKNGAIQMRQDDYRGTIEAGKVADFIIIDTNLLTCLSEKTGLAVNLKTFVDGKKIFDYEE